MTSEIDREGVDKLGRDKKKTKKNVTLPFRSHVYKHKHKADFLLSLWRQSRVCAGAFSEFRKTQTTDEVCQQEGGKGDDTQELTLVQCCIHAQRKHTQSNYSG